MHDRFIELVALGPDLRKQAERKGKSVTEAHFLVHEVLARTFANMYLIPGDELRRYVETELKRKLHGEPQRVRAACRRTGVLRARRTFERVPAVWRVIKEQGVLPRALAVAGSC